MIVEISGIDRVALGVYPGQLDTYIGNSVQLMFDVSHVMNISFLGFCRVSGNIRLSIELVQDLSTSGFESIGDVFEFGQYIATIGTYAPFCTAINKSMVGRIGDVVGSSLTSMESIEYTSSSPLTFTDGSSGTISVPSGSTGAFTLVPFKNYKLDTTKIKSLDDVISILDKLDLSISEDAYESSDDDFKRLFKES